MNRRSILRATMIAFILLAPAIVRTGLAAAEASETAIELTSMPALDNRGKPIEGQYWIMATLTAGGRPVANQTIDFREPVEFYGPREARLGSAVTDGMGLAAVIYQPSQTGQHDVTARFGGGGEYAATEAHMNLQAESVVAPFPEEPVALAGAGAWLSRFLAILGVVFWAVLLGVLGRTIWGIRRAPSMAPMRSAETRSQEVPL